MELPLEEIRANLPGCCEASVVDVASCSPEEAKFLRDMLPTACSVIVLGHHVKQSAEWRWFPFESERSGTTCAADLHARAVIERTAVMLKRMGAECAILPYPGRCGIRFKDLAVRAGLGQMGDNYLILHPQWGPWIHLRVLVTDAVYKGSPPAQSEEICIHCDLCREACPGGVIHENGFDGMLCDHTQNEEGRRLNIPGLVYKCERCLRACPIGEVPA